MTRPDCGGMSKRRRHRNRKYEVVLLILYYGRILLGSLYIHIQVQ